MRAKGVSWVGVKTDQYAAMVAFFRDIVGLDVIADQKDFLVFRLPDGDQVEIFGPRGPDAVEQFAHNEVVAGLQVDDIESAIADLRDAGVELIGEHANAGSGHSWQHFRALQRSRALTPQHIRPRCAHADRVSWTASVRGEPRFGEAGTAQQ
jgi:predicted enzyme related to lactoylglutathione lyase